MGHCTSARRTLHPAEDQLLWRSVGELHFLQVRRGGNRRSGWRVGLVKDQLIEEAVPRDQQ